MSGILDLEEATAADPGAEYVVTRRPEDNRARRRRINTIAQKAKDSGGVIRLRMQVAQMQSRLLR